MTGRLIPVVADLHSHVDGPELIVPDRFEEPAVLKAPWQAKVPVSFDRPSRQVILIANGEESIDFPDRDQAIGLAIVIGQRDDRVADTTPDPCRERRGACEIVEAVCPNKKANTDRPVSDPQCCRRHVSHSAQRTPGEASAGRDRLNTPETGDLPDIGWGSYHPH